MRVNEVAEGPCGGCVKRDVLLDRLVGALEAGPALTIRERERALAEVGALRGNCHPAVAAQ